MTDTFFYDRTISITRPIDPPNAGDGGYLGPEAVNESNVAAGYVPLTGIAAGIEYDSGGTRPLAGLPSDTESRSNWKIFLDPALAINPEQIQRNDIVTDDTALRYQVNAAIYSPLGIELRVELLPN